MRADAAGLVLFPDPLKHSGSEFDLPPGAHLFDKPGSVWMVCDGSLELLALQRRDGRPTGAREHLDTLVRGSLIWGIEQSATQSDGIQVVCLNAAPVKLLHIPATSLCSACATPASHPMLTQAVEQWISALSRGAARYIYQRRPPDRALVADEIISFPQGDRVTSRRGVVWLEVAPDSGKFLDIAPVANSSASMMVPLIPQSWFEATRPIEAVGHDTGRLLWSPDLPLHMERFHGWILHTLTVGFRNAAGAEANRLVRRADKVKADTQRTFLSFATLLDEALSEGAPKAADNALFDCSNLVASELGMTLVMPPWARRRRAGDKPMDIEDIAIASQVRVRQIVLRGHWWQEDNGPLVAYAADDNRPLALLPHGGRRYTLRDPASGIEQPVTEAVAETLSGQAHFFCASLPQRSISIADLLKFGLAPCRRDLVMLAIAGALGGLVATGVPLLTGCVFDKVIPGHQTPQMIQVALALLAAALSATVFRITADVAQLRVEGKMSGRLQAAIMDRLLRLPESFFSNFSAGDLAQRTMVVENIRRALAGPVLGSLVAGIFSIFSLALLFHYAPMVALLACFLTLILGAAACLTGMRVMKAAAVSEAQHGKLSGLVLEIVSGIVKLRLAGAEERAFNVWGSRLFQLRKSQIEVRSIFNSYSIFWSSYEILGLAIIFGAIAAAAGDHLSTGNFLAFISAFTGFMSAASSLSVSMLTLFGVTPLYRRAAPLLLTAPEAEISKGDPGVLRGDVEVSGLTFRYSPDAKPILNGVTLKVAQGEFVAITGPSGSGKSTLIRLLLGFEHAESGGVFYDGRDLRGISLQRLRRQIGVVLQSGKLMPGTIFENIQGSTGANLDECWEAAAKAGFDEEVRAMPMGMHTVLTEGTTALSGGQAQRIMIARAIVSKPRIMVMDEATSALDNRTQAMVTESLDKLSITRIVIAHRLSTIVNADRIYVLKQGEVVETGNYEELMQLDGVFADLARRQQA